MSNNFIPNHEIIANQSEFISKGKEAYLTHLRNLSGNQSLNLPISQTKISQISFSITEAFVISAEAASNRFKGKVQSGASDSLFVENETEFVSAVRREVKELNNSPAVFKQAVSVISAYKYAQLPDGKKKHLLLDNHRRHVHHYGCADCGKQGIVACQTCQQTGV